MKALARQCFAHLARVGVDCTALTIGSDGTIREWDAVVGGWDGPDDFWVELPEGVVACEAGRTLRTFTNFNTEG